MLFCLDLVMVLGLDLIDLMMMVEQWCGDGVGGSCGSPCHDGDGVGGEMVMQ